MIGRGRGRGGIPFDLGDAMPSGLSSGIPSGMPTGLPSAGPDDIEFDQPPTAGRGRGRPTDGIDPTRMGPKGLFSKKDWVCTSCGNINWDWRKQCNMCNAPRIQNQEQRTGRGGGYNERQSRASSKAVYDGSGEYDVFGRRRNKPLTELELITLELRKAAGEVVEDVDEPGEAGDSRRDLEGKDTSTHSRSRSRSRNRRSHSRSSSRSRSKSSSRSRSRSRSSSRSRSRSRSRGGSRNRSHNRGSRGSGSSDKRRTSSHHHSRHSRSHSR